VKTNRVEAFSDGVIAIIITIMVLELKAPPGAGLDELRARWPVFVSYVLSFLVVAIIWVNHHHVMHTARRADATLLWANNLLLFWMSLIPFATAYLGENPVLPLAVALYGAVLAFCSGSFALLRRVIARQQGHDAVFAGHHRRMLFKNLFAASLYAAAVPLAFLSVWAAFAIFIIIPAVYFFPDRKLEKRSD
jgi:uncharacterized membrane protein